METTTLGDDWKNYIAGLKEWSASADGNFEIAVDKEGQEALQNAFLEGTTVKVYLYVDGVHAYVGDAYVSSLSIEDPVDDIVSVSIDFTGSGEITFGGDSE
ncbi:MAG: phage tail tube protein [Bacillota bacterium]